MRGLFITGTDTGVGKTYVACAVIRDLHAAGHRVGAYKPACSGARRDATPRFVWDDVDALRTALGRDIADDRISPQRFLAPLAPPVAARREGRSVDAEQLTRGLNWWRSECDVVVVEGVGGLLCPITNTTSVADLAAQFGFPLIVVARLSLGTINHTLLTIEVARQRRLSIAGIVLSESQAVEHELAQTNSDEIVSRAGVPVLGILRHGSTDWVSRFGDPVSLNWWTFAKPQSAPK